MKPRLVRLRSGWARVVPRVRAHFPFTRLGVPVLGAAVGAVLTWGVGHQDLVALAAGGLVLSIGALSLVSAGVEAARLRGALGRGVGSGPVRTETEVATETGFAVPAPWFPWVAVEWTWTNVGGTRVDVRRARGRLEERVRFDRRCEVPHVLRRFTVGDVFGLVSFELEAEGAGRVSALPHLGALGEMPLATTRAAGDAVSHPEAPAHGDRIDFRRYVPGDPLRLVVWKLYARTGELMVRTPERALSPATHTVAYLIAGAGDGASAAAARVAVEHGGLGAHGTFAADGAEEPAQDTEAALHLIAASGHVPAAEGAAGLARFLHAQRMGALGRVVIFAPAATGPWLERCLAALTSVGASVGAGDAVEVVVGVDGVGAAAHVSRWPRPLARAFARPPDASGAGDPRTLRTLAARFAAVGARVVVVDRVSGHPLDLDTAVFEVGVGGHLGRPGLERVA